MSESGIKISNLSIAGHSCHAEWPMFPPTSPRLLRVMHLAFWRSHGKLLYVNAYLRMLQWPCDTGEACRDIRYTQECICTVSAHWAMVCKSVEHCS